MTPFQPSVTPSLRDYFAAAALQGLLATGEDYADERCDGWPWFAKAAYAIADAMLTVRANEVKP